MHFVRLCVNKWSITKSATVSIREEKKFSSCFFFLSLEMIVADVSRTISF